MTPKEKAEQLIQTYVDAMFYPDVARLAALIAVDELIIVAHDDSHFIHTKFTQIHYKYKTYWEQVKYELEEL
jgi:hypothetical protein